MRRLISELYTSLVAVVALTILVSGIYPIAVWGIAQALFPQVQGLKPGMQLFALVGANGEPIVLADSKDAAVANAWEHQLATVSLH